MAISPCGYIVDVIRGFYEANIQLDDNPLHIGRVRWFPAQPDAKCLPFPTVFASSRWDYDMAPTPAGPGEIVGTSVRVKPFSHPEYLKDHFCGLQSDFMGIDPASPPLEVNAENQPLCCIDPEFFKVNSAQLTPLTTDKNPWSADQIDYAAVAWNYGVVTSLSPGEIKSLGVGKLYQIVFNAQLAYLGASPATEALMMNLWSDVGVVAQYLVLASDCVLAGNSGQWATGLSDQDPGPTTAVKMDAMVQIGIPGARIFVDCVSVDVVSLANVGHWKISASLAVHEILHP